MVISKRFDSNLVDIRVDDAGQDVIVNALRIAADRYQMNADGVERAIASNVPLAKDWERKAAKARELMKQLDEV